VIVVYAGRRAAALGGHDDRASERIRRLIAALSPSAVVGAAADGADILVLEAALAAANGPTVHVVLPTSRDVFAEDSVEPGWRARFDAVLDEVAIRGGTIRTLDLEPGEEAYQAANLEFLDTARALAAEGERVVALVVARPGEGQMVEQFVQRAQLRGVPSLRIDPSVDLASQ
jgi:hypothetical protein